METIDGTQPASMVPHSAQRLKILVLFDTLNIANDNCTAGASSRQLRVNAELLAMGHDVRFILGDVGCHYDGWSRWPFWSALLRYDQIHQDPFRIIDALGSWTPDIVVSTNSHEVLAYGRLVADALEARLVFEVHDNDRELMAMVGADTDDLVLAETLQVQAARSADIVLTISPAEKDFLAACGVPASRIEWSPMGGSTLPTGAQGPNLSELVLAYVGNFFYEPNRWAAEELIRFVHPEVRRRVPTARVVLIGRGPADLAAQCDDVIGVTYAGFVGSLGGILPHCTFGMAHGTQGSGMKSKIVDYLGAGLPVVCSPHSTRGFEDSFPLLVADEPAQVPEVIVQAWSDPAGLLHRSSQGRHEVMARLSWPAIAERVSIAYQRALSLAPPPPPPALPSDLYRRLGHSVAAEPYWQVELARSGAWPYPTIATDQKFGIVDEGRVSTRHYAPTRQSR